MFELKDGEKLDDLQSNGFMIIQDPNDYCFTCDAVFLANFSKAKHDEVVCDLCSGSAIVPTLMHLKNEFKKCFLVEISSPACDRARRSCEGNGLMHFEIINAKIQDATNFIKQKSVDVVTINPPYYKDNKPEGEKSLSKAIARREIELSLEDIFKVSSKLLKFGGRFYMIHSSSRLDECLTLMKKYKIEPKVLQFIHPKQGVESNVFLVEGKMNGSSGVKVLAPYYVR